VFDGGVTCRRMDATAQKWPTSRQAYRYEGQIGEGDESKVYVAVCYDDALQTKVATGCVAYSRVDVGFNAPAPRLQSRSATWISWGKKTWSASRYSVPELGTAA
jgi:hypothetical protein